LNNINQKNIDILSKYRNDCFEFDFKKIAGDPKTPNHILEILASVTPIDEPLSNILIMNINCPVLFFEKCLLSQKYNHKNMMVKNPNCPVYILEKLFTPFSPIEMLVNLASNPNCPIHILESLSKYKKYKMSEKYNEFDIKKSLASNINCPLHILKEIYKKNKYKVIKLLILNHPNWKLTDFQ